MQRKGHGHPRPNSAVAQFTGMIEPTADNTQLLVTQLQAEAEAADARGYGLAIVKDLAKRLPVVGTFAAAAFDVRDRRRIERLEEAMQDLGEEVKKVADKIDANKHDAERFADVFEEWCERAARVGSSDRRRRLVTFMSRTLVDPVTDKNFDERIEFLRDLDSLSDSEAQILGRLFGPDPPRNISALAFTRTDQDALTVVVQKLRSKGLLQQPPNADMTDPRLSPLRLTPYGERFCEFFVSQNAAL
jgi:hypothetical protein